MQLQLLYITHNYATLITLHHTTLHYATLRYTNYNYSYNYNYTTLHYTTLDYTTLGYTTLHYSTVHDIIFHSATFIAPQHNYNINPTTTTTTTALHHTTSRSCEWGDHCKHCNHSKKAQLQPLFRPSVDWLCHPCITTTTLLSYSVLSLKHPPPPCAALLV